MLLVMPSEEDQFKLITKEDLQSIIEIEEEDSLTNEMKKGEKPEQKSLRKDSSFEDLEDEFNEIKKKD